MIAQKIERINALKSKITELSPLKEWDNAFFEKVKIDFTYNSNKLEGNTLTYGQTIELLKNFVTPKNAAPGELLDLINHQNILDNVFNNYNSKSLSEENIKALHKAGYPPIFIKDVNRNEYLKRFEHSGNDV